MNWMNITWPMVGAACVTLALMNLRIAIGQTPRLPYLFFFVFRKTDPGMHLLPPFG